MTELTWVRRDGVYVAAVSTADRFTDRSWQIRKSADRSWVVESVTVLRRSSTYGHSLPPVSVDTFRHGTAYTLREAKESVGRFHAAERAVTQ